MLLIVSAACHVIAGYGDNLNIMNSIHLLQQYVEKQNKVWLSMEMDKGRGVDLADVEDPRVDLCLFCIQAHRLRPVDLRRVCSLLLVFTSTPNRVNVLLLSGHCSTRTTCFVHL